MLTALILVCSVAVTPELRDCDRTNAVHVLQLPEETGNPLIDNTAGLPGLTGTAARTAAEAYRRGTDAVSAARSFLDDLRGHR